MRATLYGAFDNNPAMDVVLVPFEVGEVSGTHGTGAIWYMARIADF